MRVDIDSPEIETKQARLDELEFLDEKAADQEGTFSGFANVTGHVDSYGDIVEQGAFAQTIKKHKGVFPIFEGHSDQIGAAEVEEITGQNKKTGLKVTRGELFLDMPEAQRIYARMKANRRVGMKDEMSIGWSPVKGKVDYIDGKTHLREVRLYHIGILPPYHAANDKSTVDRIKSYTQSKEESEIGRLQDRVASLESKHDELMGLLKTASDNIQSSTIKPGDIEQTTEFAISEAEPTEPQGKDSGTKETPKPSDSPFTESMEEELRLALADLEQEREGS